MYVITGLGTGGAERMLHKLLTHSASASDDPVVVSLMDKGTMGEQIESLGVPVLCLGMTQGKPFASYPELRRITRRIEPDIVHGWMYHANLAALLAAKACRKTPPLIWNIRHSLSDIRAERPLTRWIIRANAWLSSTPDALVFNSRRAADQHKAFGFSAESAVVIPNGFPVAETETGRARCTVRRELGLTDETVLVGLIARYHPMKDHANFMQALVHLQSPPSDWAVVLCGNGVDDNNRELAPHVTAARKQVPVFMMGERSDVGRITAALDIAVSSSAWGEGFSNAVGEAMSYGVPCIVTDVGDSAWIVGDTGRVVPPASPAAMAEALDDMLNLSKEARRDLGARAMNRMERHFALSAIVKRYMDLHEGLATGTPLASRAG